MKIKPMIFNSEMVKALLDRRKTVTRRPMKPQPEPSGRGYDWWPSKAVESMIQVSGLKDDDDGKKDIIRDSCPIVCEGDLIYVRETFRIFQHSDECGCSDHCNCPPTGTALYFATHYESDNKWWPSIHMPRWASRLTLKVTDVRIETLNELRKCEDQIKKEGFENWPQFKHVWESIYGQSNPNDYVWVIEFEVIHQNVDKYLEAINAGVTND